MGNKKYVIVGYVILVFIILILTLHLRQKYNQVKESEMNRLTAEALLESYTDNTRAIRIIEAAYKKGLPEPSSRTYQVLSEIGYSSFSRPFYIVKLEHNGPINSANFSLDENKKLTVLTASEDGTIKRWSLYGHLLFKFKIHTSRITQVTFSIDGRKALIASADGTAKLLNLKDESIKIFRHHGVVSSAVFSPKGERILTGSWDKTAKLWDLEGRLLVDIQGHNQALSSAVFSPDGKFILTASWDRSASVWDLNGNKIASMNHDSGLSDAQFFPDNKTILSASDDGVVKVWNLQENLLFEDKNNSIISAIAISPDGKNFCASSEDGFCRIWHSDKQKWKLASELKQDGVATTVEFSRNNSHIITSSSDGKARIYKINGELQAVLPHSKAVLSASLSADGTLAITSSEDGTAKMWELKNDLVSVIEPKQGEVSRALYSQDGKKILVAFADNVVNLYDECKDKNTEYKLNKDSHVSSIAMSFDGKSVLACSSLGEVKKWDMEGKLNNEKYFSNDFVLATLFTPDGKRILLNLASGKSVIWSFLDNSEINLKHESPISISAVSTQGDKILTISDDLITKIWDMNGVELNRFKIEAQAMNAGFSEDGKLIRLILKSGKIKEWGINGLPGKEIMLSEQPVHSAVFSSNSDRILLGMEDGRSLLYSIDGKLLGESKFHKTPISYISYSSKGMKFITISRDSAIVQATPEGILGWLKDSRIPELNGKYPEKKFD